MLDVPLPVNPSSKFFYNTQFVHFLTYLVGTKLRYSRKDAQSAFVQRQARLKEGTIIR